MIAVQTRLAVKTVDTVCGVEVKTRAVQGK